MQKPGLRSGLRTGASLQSAPYLEKDDFDCYYACIRCEGGFLMMCPMLHHRNRAIAELSGRVAEVLNKPRYSGYVSRCKDYVRQHYREKILLEDVAQALGISPTYLSPTYFSHLFKKEAGGALQNFYASLQAQ